MTKPIIVTKMPCKILYVIKSTDNFNFLALLETFFGGHLKPFKMLFLLTSHLFTSELVVSGNN